MLRRKAIRKISTKRRKIIPVEKNIKHQIWLMGNGLCEWCQKEPISDRGHEIKFRSHGGSPTDVWNIIQLCDRCHKRQHNLIKDEPPIPVEALKHFVIAIRVAQGWENE